MDGSGTTTLAVPSVPMARDDRLGQRQVVLALLVVVVVLDQAMKWWAWRHAPMAIINDGGDPLVGETVSGWYAGPVTGALLDVLSVGLLSTAVFVLVRRRLPARVFVPGALMIDGWSSNLLDRLGMHFWTAPGSVRGAVDFIHLGHHCYNVADFFIAGATPAFLLSLGWLARRAMSGSTASGPAAPAWRPRLRTSKRLSVLAGVVVVIVVVWIGAVNCGGVTAHLA